MIMLLGMVGSAVVLYLGFLNAVSVGAGGGGIGTVVGLSTIFASVHGAVGDSDLHLDSVGFSVRTVSKVLTREAVSMEGSDLAGDYFFLGTSLSGEVGALFLHLVEE